MKYFLLIPMILIISCSNNNEEKNNQNTNLPNDTSITKSTIDNSDLAETKETEINNKDKAFIVWLSNNFEFNLPKIKVKDYQIMDDSNYYYFHLHIDTIWVFKDLNNDNVKDLLVTGYENTGGSGCWVHLYSILNNKGKAMINDLLYFGDRVQVDSVRMINDTIKVYSLVHGPEDGLCCPSVPFVFLIKNNNGKLIQLNKKPKYEM